MRILRFAGIAAAIVVVLFTALWFWLLHTESGANRAWELAQRFSADALTGGPITGDFGGGFSMADVGWSADGTDVSIESVRGAIDVDLLPPALTISMLSLGDTDVSLHPAETAEEPAPVDIRQLLGALRLPFSIELREFRTGHIDIRVAEAEPIAIDGVDLALTWDDQVRVQNLDVRAAAGSASLNGAIGLSDDLPLDVSLALKRLADSAELTVRGTLSAFEFTLDASAAHPELGMLTANARGTGSESALDVLRLRVEGDTVALSGSGQGTWAGGVSAAASIDLRSFALHRLLPAWPDTHPLTGSFDVRAFPDRIEVHDARVRVQGTDAELAFNAGLSLADLLVDGGLEWSQLQWPIDAVDPQVRSESGEVRLTGLLHDWQVQGLIQIGTLKMPDGRFAVAGEGTLDDARVTINEGNAFGGSVIGEIEYNWRGDQPWAADLSLTSVRIDDLAPGWPGVIGGNVSAHGTQRPFSVNATLTDVSGEVRGEPFRAHGVIAHGDDVIRADDLRVEHGGLRALLDGSADTSEGLRFEFDVDALEVYAEQLSGGLQARGAVSRHEQRPFLSLTLDSDDIRVGDTLLSDLRIRDRRAGDDIANLELAVAQADIAGQRIGDLSVDVTVAPDRQSLRMSGTHLDSDLLLSVDGAFADWRRPLESEWTGTIDAFEIDLDDEHTMRLEQPAPLNMSSTAFSLEGFCAADRTGSRICLDAAKSDALSLNAQISNLPLELIEHAVESDLIFEQHLSGMLEWRSAANGALSGTADLSLSAGQIAVRGRPDLGVATGDGTISVNMADGQLLSGSVAIPLPGVGGIDGRFAVRDVTRTIQSTVDGNVDVAIDDLGVLAFLVPQVDALGGALNAAFNIAGTVEQPVFGGNVNLDGGDLRYAPIGLHLQDISLDGELQANRSVLLEGRFRAGEGVAEIVSSADYSNTEQPGLRFKVRGDRLRLIDVPDVQAVVRPDVQVAFVDGTLTIDGVVNIPEARISPSNLTENRVSESGDVVLTRGSLPDADAEKEPVSDIDYAGELKLSLGDNVVVDLDVAKANLTGAATFSWHGDAMPQADGRFDLNGNIEAFGQVLEISEGAIRFPNVSADEPNVRIRAEREIFGNSQVKRAGVLVDGAASRPTVEAYTIPLTTEERALTLLVTGSDFDYEQGVGAVDFGTYIAPRLFVSYGIGIFDRDNIISARYDLARGFGIKASSGSKESGIDLNYRFER